MEGLKKPEQAIFDLTLSKLGVEAHEAVFLDDLGRNLKTARLMGMTTIRVSFVGVMTLYQFLCTRLMILMSLCKHWTKSWTTLTTPTSFIFPVLQRSLRTCSCL